jgi:4a-hydroxytetrahydrobiopterin dehydratase
MTDVLSSQQASDAVTPLGWRFLLGMLRTCVPVTSMSQAGQVAAWAVAVVDADADEHLSVDIRPAHVLITLQTASIAATTARDVELAKLLSAAVSEMGLATQPDGPRSAQALEIAIDAIDIPAIRPFWKAVMGYADEPGSTGPSDPLADPLGQGPAIWFQQMDAPRPQRNRIHIDISVPHDEAPRRLQAALAAGGRLVSDAAAPAFWVLADAEGNEACITTWQGRD